MWELLKDWLTCIPKTQSHYAIEKTSKYYFDNPLVTMKSLYEMFTDYLASVKGCGLNTISECSFRFYFNSNFNIGFSQPKSDVCDFCYEINTVGLEHCDEQKKSDYLKHKTLISQHKQHKKNLMIFNDSTLVLEVDYSQNKPLPKLPVNACFYLRLLWFFICNIHVHNSDKSYMFYFVEGEHKKGANSVCSFINTVLKELITDKIKNLVIFSDGSPAQNKNHTIVKYLNWISIKYKLKIIHLYAVKGHSYCKSDANFALISNKVKKYETIESLEIYLQIMKDLSFEVRKANIKDYETFLRPFFEKKY